MEARKSGMPFFVSIPTIKYVLSYLNKYVSMNCTLTLVAT